MPGLFQKYPRTKKMLLGFGVGILSPNTAHSGLAVDVLDASAPARRLVVAIGVVEEQTDVSFIADRWRIFKMGHRILKAHR